MWTENNDICNTIGAHNLIGSIKIRIMDMEKNLPPLSLVRTLRAISAIRRVLSSGAISLAAFIRAYIDPFKTLGFYN